MEFESLLISNIAEWSFPNLGSSAQADFGLSSMAAEIGRFVCSKVALGLMSLSVLPYAVILKSLRAMLPLLALPGPPLTIESSFNASIRIALIFSSEFLAVNV